MNATVKVNMLPMPGHHGLYPETIIRLENGAVVCIWRGRAKAYAPGHVVLKDVDLRAHGSVGVAMKAAIEWTP